MVENVTPVSAMSSQRMPKIPHTILRALSAPFQGVIPLEPPPSIFPATPFFKPSSSSSPPDARISRFPTLLLSLYLSLYTTICSSQLQKRSLHSNCTGPRRRPKFGAARRRLPACLPVRQSGLGLARPVRPTDRYSEREEESSGVPTAATNSQNQGSGSRLHFRSWDPGGSQGSDSL